MRRDAPTSIDRLVALAVAIFIAALVLGAVKLSDIVVSQIALSQLRIPSVAKTCVPRRLRARIRREIPREPDPEWSWITERAKRAREAKPGGPSAVIGMLVDWVFRAPAVAGIQSLLVFIGVGTIRGVFQKHACVLKPAISDTDAWLAVAAALSAIAVASSMVGIFLFGTALNLDEPTRIAGQVPQPSKPRANNERPTPLPGVVVIPVVAASLIAAFASFDLALAAVQPNAFHTEPCSFGPISTVYFSTVVAATVGFGDIAPTAPVARAFVVIQMFSVVTFLAVFLSELQRRPDSKPPARIPPRQWRRRKYRRH